MVSKTVIAALALAGAATFSVAAGDPTRPHNWRASQMATDTSAGEPLQLTQIIAFADKRYAMINGQRYQLGSRVGGYRIIAIENQRVRLQNAQQELELTLFKNDIKTLIVTEGESE